MVRLVLYFTDLQQAPTQPAMFQPQAYFQGSNLEPCMYENIISDKTSTATSVSAIVAPTAFLL